MDVMTLGRMATITDPTGARVSLWQAGDIAGTELANEPGTPIWNELISPDVKAATAFYTDVLGVGWDETDMGEGATYYILRSGERQVGGASAPMMPDQPPHWNVYFNVADVDAAMARAVELGGRVVAPAFDVEGVGRMGYLADPQSAAFAVMAG